SGSRSSLLLLGFRCGISRPCRDAWFTRLIHDVGGVGFSIHVDPENGKMVRRIRFGERENLSSSTGVKAPELRVATSRVRRQPFLPVPINWTRNPGFAQINAPN